MAKERIGILGGTFDPIHIGHIRMAHAARKSAGLDRVLVIPDRTPPHKPEVSSAEDRWRMVCAACAQEEGLEPCRMELDRNGTTYSVDTLLALHARYPKAELYFIIGSDTVTELNRWHAYEQLITLCTFLVCPRTLQVTSAEYATAYRKLTEDGAKLSSVEMETINVSSTEIRQDLINHTPNALISPVIREYAEVIGLYGLTARLPDANRWMPQLFQDLTNKRFAHTLAVAYTARNLALHHDVDVIRAETGALLHDCAKCLPLEQMQMICQNSQTSTDPSLMENGSLLHAGAGAILAESLYNIHDRRILDAIACHTTGKEGMSKLDMVVYLADKIEPTRPSYPLLDKVRLLSMVSLEKAMCTSLTGTSDYVTKKGGKPLHPQTKRTLAWLKSLPGTSD